jgi:hypothetical protein
LQEACDRDEELGQKIDSLPAFAAPALEIAAKMVAEDKTPSLVSQQIGSNKVLAPSGVGGVGEVYLAEGSRLGCKIALRLLPEPFCNDECRIRRFERGARRFRP